MPSSSKQPFRFVYQDECGEPGKNQDYFLIGLLRVREREPLYAAIKRVRNQFHFENEIKFQKVSNLRVQVYLEIMKNLAPLRGIFSFSAIAVSRDKLDISKFGGKRHLAYNFFTQLLLSHRLAHVEEAVVYVDDKSRIKADNFLSYLKDWTNVRAGREVIKAVEPLSSKADDLVQITDLFLGCCNTDLGHENGPRKKLIAAEAKRMKLVTPPWIWEPD